MKFLDECNSPNNPTLHFLNDRYQSIDNFKYIKIYNIRHLSSKDFI